jgi:MarR family transcriptional regulator for hemolysin
MADNQVTNHWMPMSSLDERFSQALHASARSWRQALDRRLRASGLSQAGWSAVAAAAAAVRPLSQTELAQQLGVEGATMVATIDRLVAVGMVERAPSAIDRRVKLVVVTARGLALSNEVQQQAAVLRREWLRDIDPDRMAVAAGVLEQLQRVLENQA